MKRRGIQHTHIYSVDNVLTKPADPVFVAYCLKANALAGAKVVPKVKCVLFACVSRMLAHFHRFHFLLRQSFPTEAVGVFGTKNGVVSVIEYSEMPSELCTAVDEVSGRLRFNAGNICSHYCSIAFLEAAAQWTRCEMRYVPICSCVC